MMYQFVVCKLKLILVSFIFGVNLWIVEPRICERGREGEPNSLTMSPSSDCSKLVLGGANTLSPVKQLKPNDVNVSLESGYLSTDNSETPTSSNTTVEPTATFDTLGSVGKETPTSSNTTVEPTATFDTLGSVGKACESGIPLGMQDRRIINSGIKASSYLAQFKPFNARLHNGKSWCDFSSDHSPWLQVDLIHLFMVTGLQTQGGGSYWVEQFKVQTKSGKEDDFEFIQSDNGGQKIFNANTDFDNVTAITFDTIVRTKLIRIYPTVCKPGGVLCCLRLEVLGCSEDGSVPVW